MKVKWHLYGGNYHADLGPIHFVVQRHRHEWVLLSDDVAPLGVGKIVGRYGSLREAKNAISLLATD
jgi:hypothetical protein